MKALSQYFLTLRGTKSRAELAYEAGISEMSILRIEVRGQKPKPDTLKKLVLALHARWEDIDYLLGLNGGDEVDEGRKLAERVRFQIHNAPTVEDRRMAIQRLIAELEADPRKLDQLIGYGQRLRDEDRRNGEH